MIKIEKLISKAYAEPEGDVFFTGIQIVRKGTPEEYYIDPRTWTRPDGLKVVWPFCHSGSHDFYVCPDCGKIHIAFKYGKQETGCCEDIDCERRQCVGEEDIYIQRNPVIVNEPDEPIEGDS